MKKYIVFILTFTLGLVAGLTFGYFSFERAQIRQTIDYLKNDITLLRAAESGRIEFNKKFFSERAKGHFVILNKQLENAYFHNCNSDIIVLSQSAEYLGIEFTEPKCVAKRNKK
ncbi:MAG: hypothetical protein V2I33_04575 [Kangiellaceae bacterium]|jgi:hypothetical protein|nr:hypothetical protein [Kangiellaceae bacterium]